MKHIEKKDSITTHGIESSSIKIAKYRLLVVKEAMFYTRTGVSNIINPFGKCKTLEPIALASGILSEGLDVQLSELEIANYFGLSLHDAKKILFKHRQLIAVNKQYKLNHEKCLLACKRMIRIINMVK